MERQEALRSVVSLSQPLDEALSRLRAYEYSWPHSPLVELDGSDVIAVLERYLAGALEASQVERWADAIEGREDIEFAPGKEEILSKVLFRLSTPEITEVLTRELALRIVNELRSPGTAV
jgi:hypothetical protein